MRATLLAVVAASTATLGSAALAQDTTLAHALAANAFPFTPANGVLRGPGAEFLARAARENEFLLVGEDHGIREMPQLVTALYALARPAGYRHLAIELGPITTRALEPMMRSDTALVGLSELLHRHTRFSLPFFNWREEAEMLAAVVHQTPLEHDVLWGLDQEFILAPSYLFERLAGEAPTAAARALADSLARQSAAADQRMIAKRDPDAVWMATSSNADVSELRETFRGARGEAAELLDELLESREIYRAFFEHRNYESNSQRSELMRRHFAAYLARARRAGEGQPKAVVKLGANHVFRGPSTTDTYEIGAFAHELALASGSHAFGMLVVVAKGTLNAYRPFGSVEADKHKSFDARDAFSFTDLTPFLSAASTKSYTLFDLRPILAAVHDGRTAPVRPKVLRLLQSFDALIVIPEGHASTLIE